MPAESLSMHYVKESELRLLRIIDSYFRENELRYSLSVGTLLGAARHKSSIPWGDDIDVCMPVKDYRRLLAEFPSRVGAEHSCIGLASQLNFKGSAAIPLEKLVDASIELKSAYIVEGICEYLPIGIFPIASLVREAEANKVWDAAVRFKHLFQASRWSLGQLWVVGLIKTVLGTIARHTSLQHWVLGRLRALTDSGSFSTIGFAADLSRAVGSSLEYFREPFQRSCRARVRRRAFLWL